MHCYFRVVCVALVLPAFSQFVCLFVVLFVRLCVCVYMSLRLRLAHPALMRELLAGSPAAGCCREVPCCPEAAIAM